MSNEPFFDTMREFRYKALEDKGDAGFAIAYALMECARALDALGFNMLGDSAVAEPSTKPDNAD